MRLLPALLVLLSAASPTAQTVVPLDEALGLAETNAIDVLRAEAQVQSAQIAAQSLDAQRWPSLALNLGGGQRYGLSFDQTSGGLTQSTVESMDVGVSASYVVFDGFERRARVLSAEADVQAARLTRERAEQHAGVAVLNGYLAVAQAEAAREIAVETVAAERDLLAEIAVQVDVGLRPPYERSQQEERVAAAEGAIVAAERDRALAAVRLVRLLALDSTQDYVFPAPSAPAVTSPAPEADLVGRALESRRDLRAAEASVRAAEADARAARSTRLPSVSLNAYLGTSFTSAADDAFVPQVGDNRAGSLRLGITVPIFDRGLSRQRVRLAEAQASALRSYQEDARRAVALEVQELGIRVTALTAQADIAATRVRAAEEALAAERARFDAGESTLQSVSLLRARAVEARTNQAQLGVEARFQRALLARAVGDVD